LRVGGKLEPVGSYPELAYVEWGNREICLRAEAAGITLPAQRGNRTTINDAIASYLEEVQTNKFPRAHAAYKQSLGLFRTTRGQKRISMRFFGGMLVIVKPSIQLRHTKALS
jgi:hypothetical protein